MDLETGKIHHFKDEAARKLWEEYHGTKLVPLTEKKAKELKPLSNRRRKALLAGMSCPCGSGKSFKKCCWKKYKGKRRATPKLQKAVRSPGRVRRKTPDNPGHAETAIQIR